MKLTIFIPHKWCPTMSDTSKKIDDTTQKWQVLITEVFKEFEPNFESMFLEGSANEDNKFKKIDKGTGFAEEIKNGA